MQDMCPCLSTLPVSSLALSLATNRKESQCSLLVCLALVDNPEHAVKMLLSSGN